MQSLKSTPNARNACVRGNRQPNLADHFIGWKKCRYRNNGKFANVLARRHFRSPRSQYLRCIGDSRSKSQRLRSLAASELLPTLDADTAIN